MNNIEISCYDIKEASLKDSSVDFSEDRIRSLLLDVLRILEKDNWEVSVVLTNDKTIQKLNKDYRGLDEATDVLSFCQKEADCETAENISAEEEIFSAGDIIISLETLKKNALFFDVEEQTEFNRLLVHGLLHLAGWDHESNDHKEPMLVFQETILKKTQSV